MGAVKDDGPTGQTTGQTGSDPSAYTVSITGYYNILQGIKPETTKKPGYYYRQMHTLRNTA